MARIAGRGALSVLILITFTSTTPAADKPAGSDATHPLATAISQIVTGSALSGARMSLLVSSLDTGQVIYAHRADELLNPASNVKLFTAAVALARLGPDFRFDTELYVDGSSPVNTPHVLFVRGKGDPSMTTERLWAVAGDLVHLGLRSVKEVVVEDSYFDSERKGPGYDQEHGDRSYLAPAGALSLNFNNVAIHVSPGARAGEKGRVELEPSSEFFTIDNRTLTVKAGARRRVTPSSAPVSERQRITVEGRLPVGSRNQSFYRRIDDPPVYFGYTLKRLLELRGAKVGKVRRGKVPTEARLLLAAQSEPLGDITRRLLKTSNNFIAEQILKTLGAELKGTPGTWPKGVEAVEDFLTELGLPRGSYLMMNGSGLNDTNRFSARQTVTLLREMWRRFPLMAEFVGALPVAGKDGTIQWRMDGTEAEGHLRAKTGTLESASSLSGYVDTRGGERLVFAILVNDYSGRARPIVRAVDAIGSAMAASGGTAAALGTAVATASTPPLTLGAEPIAVLETRAASYYQLAKQADQRNVPFLRTALRHERDPVLQMAAAEAIYLSDPDNDAAQRTFLESITTSEACDRLQALAAKLKLAPPLIGSLGDLAAEGDPEALARLVELAPITMASGPVASTFVDTWVEVTRTAPEEALAALRTSSTTATDSTLDAFARGLIRSHETKHPFPETMRRIATGNNTELAAFARSVLYRFEDRWRAAKTATEPPAHPAAATAQPVPAPSASP